ncbi:DUF2513 domain-containing protein [Bosea sp. (in: a-proteobacteria)]|uniref:DUF2513 domain-containing protein n=1 Tax=Bosea sp. (in: a-proteobacteria) TaxID=1871050 RepID=UPI001AC77FA5|nr:DUF2513 domain-containing protein [Bosea sp. (in: a-proteobacteria)]MBN9438067.1 DUF2513 domain-containing protein [Bosea sp. (in: a-proteobacteria)]
MRRDMELIRAILLKLEELPARPGTVHALSIHDEELKVEDYNPKVVGEHLEMLLDAGLIISVDGELHNGSRILFQRISWQGHEFLATVRDKEIWEQTKKALRAGGVETIKAVWDIAKAIGTNELKRRTGLEV